MKELMPFDKVLVRDDEAREWSLATFYYRNKSRDSKYPFVTVSYTTHFEIWRQCIPFAGNEHRLHKDSIATKETFSPGDKVQVSNNGVTWIDAVYLLYNELKNAPFYVFNMQTQCTGTFAHCRHAEWEETA